MIPVPRPNLIAGMEHRAGLTAARRALGRAGADHQNACPACIADPITGCSEKARLRAEWDAAWAAEEASPPGSPA